MGRIQNFEALATTEQRKDALAIVEAGYAAVDVRAALPEMLHIENDALHISGTRYPLKNRRIFFVGVGKCSFAAATAIEKIFDGLLSGGVVLDVSENVPGGLGIIETHVGTHPLPSEQNVAATARIIELLTDLKEDDLVILFISGGGSTLLCQPEAPMTCFDESTLFRELTESGASIQEINTVRKHISRARGGGLAAAAYPAEVLSLIVSDVPGNDIQFIASGPTVLDTSTIKDAETVVARYANQSKTAFTLRETPKEQKYFERVVNILFLTSQSALDAMEREAVSRGYQVKVENDHFSGEARDVGRAVVERLHRNHSRTALLYAGESVVTLTSEYGAGGRNQELVLSALDELRDGEILVSFASDGHDNTDHAGAIGDSLTKEHTASAGLLAKTYLDAHRSYDFFKTTGDAIYTGYTGSNVSDLIIALKN